MSSMPPLPHCRLCPHARLPAAGVPSRRSTVSRPPVCPEISILSENIYSAWGCRCGSIASPCVVEVWIGVALEPPIGAKE